MPRSLLAAGALVAAAAVAATSNSARNGFVWDDRAAILGNADVHGRGSLAELLAHDFWGKDLRSADSHKSFRPLTVLSFRLNHQLAGFQPAAYHAANSAAHALCSLLVWVLARRLLDEQGQGIDQAHRAGSSSGGALLAGLLFAVHPVHCDAVASIVGRADLLCTMLSLSAVLVYMNAVQSARPGRSWMLFVAALTLTAASCVAKELGFTTFGILFVYDVLQAAGQTDKDGGRLWRWRLPLLVAIGSMLAALRVHLNGEHRQMKWNILANSVAVHPDRTARLLSYAHIHAWYLWKLVWPRWLSFDYGFDTIPVITSVTDVKNCLTAAAYVAVLAGAGVAARQFYRAAKTNQRHSPAFIMSLALGIIPFVPASNIFFPVGTVVAERLLYLPSVGFCLLVALVVSSALDTANKYVSLPEAPGKGSSRRRWLRTASTVIVASCAFIVATGCFRSRARNTEWESESKLFEASLRVAPTNVKVLSNTAKTLLHSDPDRALAYLRVSYDLAPGHPETLINIGVAFTTKQDRLSAIRYYAKALRDDPEHPSVRNPTRCARVGLASHTRRVHSLQGSSAEGCLISGAAPMPGTRRKTSGAARRSPRRESCLTTPSSTATATSRCTTTTAGSSPITRASSTRPSSASNVKCPCR